MTTIQIMPFKSLGTPMINMSISSGAQISTNIWLKESTFLALVETLKNHVETSPEKTISFDITDDGKRAE